MRFAYTDEQEALRREARRFLDSHSTPKQVRRAMASESGFDAEVWARIGDTMGWPSLIIDEKYGGAGLSQVELVGVMEETGRALLAAPLFSSVCLAANTLLVGGSEAQKAEHLPDIASGERLATLALSEAQCGWDPAGIGMNYRQEGGGGDYLLSGDKTYVPDGHLAGLILVAARAAAGDGLSVFIVPGDARGLSRRALPTMDQTRRQAELRFDRVRVPASALVGEAGRGIDIIERTLDLAATALAAEQVGGAERCLDMAVEYANVRVQFGRPIGSFQAIKHKCADMLLLIESARSAAWYAGWAAAHAPSELPSAAATARALASDAFFQCAAENIQIHGGIGFTWEHDAHLYFKRAQSTSVLLGAASFWREREARRMGLSI